MPSFGRQEVFTFEVLVLGKGIPENREAQNRDLDFGADVPFWEFETKAKSSSNVVLASVAPLKGESK